MNSIEKISRIDKSNLNEEFYFRSLIEEAVHLKMLTEKDVERIQYECFELLARKTESYTRGESSSIRVETAEKIMNSNLYTIGIWLKSFNSADDAVQELNETKISDLCEKGRKRIETKLKSAHHIHMMVMKNLVNTKNYTYNATIIEGISGFFKIYNPDYEAQEIHITADYPLSNPVESLAGIEFVLKYLECIYYENMFCSFFSPDDIHHLLSGYAEDYCDLIINIYDHVLTVAIGCKVAETFAANLNITHVQRKYITRILSGKSDDEISMIILKANRELQEELSINNIYLKHYIENSLAKVISEVINAVQLNTIEKVFVEKKYPELNDKIYFLFGEKMDDEKYRSIVDEITQCRFLSDKILIIKNKISSLADLEDLLVDVELSEHEITAVIKELKAEEIAALAKYHPFVQKLEDEDISDAEKKLRQCLQSFIIREPLERRNFILKTIRILEDDRL